MFRLAERAPATLPLTHSSITLYTLHSLIAEVLDMERLGLSLLAALLLLIGSSGGAWADDYTETIKIFREAGASSGFFDDSYGYAIFPTIGKAGVGIGGAYGKGRVYKKGAYVGDTSMKQLTFGWQLGAQGYSQIVFFQHPPPSPQFTPPHS